MYNRNIWNEIYAVHFKDAPWMSNECVEGHLTVMERFITDVRDKRFLDYGCGNGRIAYHFYHKGARIVLADSSDTLVEWLKKEYAEDGIEVLTAATPQDLPDAPAKRFDYIVASSLMHHIQPELWMSFMKGFTHLLKHNGILIISGWDESDDLIMSRRIAPFTKNTTWPINSLIQTIKRIRQLELVANELHDMALPSSFTSNRKFRYYVLKKK